MSNPRIYAVHGATVIEWTPSFVLTRSRSLWPDNPKGKNLTNHKILQYMRDGRYGPDAQQKAQEESASLTLKAKQRRVKAERLRQAREKEEKENAILTAKYV